MSHKENVGTANVPHIKSEPQEQHVVPLKKSSSWQSSSGESKPIIPVVKPEPHDIARVPTITNAVSDLQISSSSTPVAQLVKAEYVAVAQAKPSISEPPRKLYNVYTTAEDIQYLPESALKEGLGMVKTLKSSIKKLELGSKLRKDVWLREIESLQSQGAPTTMIAVCGATGAGKSSILNAILDACTAVVTEIGYHARKTIDADVSFLSEQEWREELSVLLDDLVDEDGHLKHSTDLRSDAGIAWSKVHAVYPSISQEQMMKLTIDQIIARDPKIAKILGTTKHITAPDSKIFAKEIGKYIDSKDQKRGDKKDKSKSKEKNKEPSLMDKLRKEVGKKKKDEDSDGPAYWPLIRQVNVRCSSRALSTGAILVDLPGVADANAARNNIAKDYMKKCDCVWILAPITRAVDDKTARDLMGDAFKMQLMMDGNYDANAITFIATKCDDISCSEVIRALNLETEPVLEEIEEQIEKCKEETHEWKGKKSEAEASAKEIDKQLKEAREYLKEYQAHLEALENDEDFEPVLTAKASKAKKSETSQSKKQKNTRGGKKASPKKRRADHDDDDPMDEDDDMDEDLDFSESESEKNSDKDQDGSDGSQSGSGSEDEDAEMAGSGSEEESEDEEVTIDSLKAKIEDTRNAIKAGRVQLSEHRKQRKEASDMLATLKKKQVKAQREKNAFCSL